MKERQVLANVSTQEAADLTFWMMEPPRGDWAFTVLGGLHGQSRQDLDADGWADMPGYKRGVLRPRLFWENGKGRTLFTTLGVMAEDRRGGTLAGAAAPDGRPFVQFLDTRRVDTGSVLRIPLAGNRLVTLRGSLAWRSERRLLGDFLERGRQITWFGEAVLMGSSGRHNWLVGGALQQDAYDGRDLPAFDYRFTTPGLFLQDEIELGNLSTLGISARLDHHSRYGTFASPRLSLLHKPAPGWRLRLSAGTGFFAPTPFTEETIETGLARLRIPLPLAAERARGASIDASWSRRSFEVVATLYGSHVRHPSQHRTAAAGAVELVNSNEPVRTWGTELLGRYRREGFVLMATHGFSRSTEGNPEAFGRREVPLTPRNSASLIAIWETEDWGRVGVEVYYTGRQWLEENPYRSRGRGCLIFGTLIEKRFGAVRAFINFENLGNVRQTRYDPLVRPSRAADGRWTVDAWAPLDGRVINGGLRFPF